MPRVGKKTVHVTDPVLEQSSQGLHSAGRFSGCHEEVAKLKE